jgi:hypothetical protein
VGARRGREGDGVGSREKGEGRREEGGGRGGTRATYLTHPGGPQGTRKSDRSLHHQRPKRNKPPDRRKKNIKKFLGPRGFQNCHAQKKDPGEREKKRKGSAGRCSGTRRTIKIFILKFLINFRPTTPKFLTSGNFST